MHIPDGYLGPVTYGSLWAAMVPIWLYGSRKIKKGVEAAHVPFLAMASVFSLVVMVFAIPLPGGTTGHLNGVTLIAILMGPWNGLMAVSVALTIQALIFAQGGITSLGANCFNIAFAGGTGGYLIYSLIVRIGSTFVRHPTDNRPTPQPPKSSLHLIGAGVASYFSVNLVGILGGLQLGLQPILHPDSAFYFPFPLKIVLPAVMIPHLTVLGLMEVSLTVLVLLVILKSQTSTIKRSKKPIFPF